MRFLTISLAVMLLVVGCSCPSDALLYEGEEPVQVALDGLPCEAAPQNPELLDTLGDLALYSGETVTDVASNKMRVNGDDPYHNSLFLRRRRADGTDEWRVLLTTGSNWRDAAEMSEWESSQSSWLKAHFCVRKAKFASDWHNLWLVCDVCNPWYSVVCSCDMQTHVFHVLMDGRDIEEEADGTVRIKDKKFYPNDDLGAAWHDVWIDSNGKVVREGEITLRGSDM